MFAAVNTNCLTLCLFWSKLCARNIKLKMLKAINTSETFINLVEKKCAEVYFRKENFFTIICTHCKLKTFDFGEYALHFKNAHLPWKTTDISEPAIGPVEIEIKTEQDNEPDSDREFCPLNESQEIQLSDMANFTSPRAESYEIRVDILEDGNNWTSEDDSENSEADQSEQDQEHTARILNVDRSSKNTNSAEFQCQECEKSYKFSKNLERHINKCHNQATNYSCARCKQNFCDERSLYAHQRKKHAGYPCGECDKVYSSKEALNIHSYNHKGTRDFHCNVEGCGKSFFNPKNLAMHTRIVHRLEKNFVCEVCGFRTKGQPALIVHKRSHTGEKPFVCNLCGKGFASKSLLCEHEPTHSTERPHVCNVCGRSFARPKALYHHKHLHLGIKKFVCKLCGRAYAQMAGLAGHMRQHKAEN